MFEEFAQTGRWSLDSSVDSILGGRYLPSMSVLSAWLQAGPHRWVLGLGNSGSFSPEVFGFFPEVLPVEVLAEEGIIGFSLFIAFLWVVFKTIVRVYSSVSQNKILRGLVAVNIALFVFEAILSLKQGSLLFNQHIFCFGIILARYEHVMRLYFQQSDRTVISDQITKLP